MFGCARKICFSRIYNYLLRTLILIILGCVDINNGLSSSYVDKENILLNQNLIISQQLPVLSTSSMSTADSGINILQTRLRQSSMGSNHNDDESTNTSSGSSNPSSSISSSITEDNLNKETAYEDIYKSPMYFGTENSTVITTQIGATAHIPCTIHNIGDGVVSWIRRKDYHLLTVGLTTYSSDERFSATHLKHSEDWTLQIKFVQLRDAGIYECQVSTHPPTSIFLALNVVEARAEISGPPIRYLTPGSTLRLMCRVLQNTEASEFIFWYHDNRMINYDIDRGINVSTEADFQSSELTISRTRREHSGNYTCVASNAQPASVLVHIFKGDNPAAMYHGHVGSSNKSYQNQLLLQIMFICTVGYSTYVSHVQYFV
ncbi:uncharacterized protein LOC119660463 isoform X2 [Hermetia illucens]|uniref:uncharacterized protein LOC119660463 isoform X2 n=1 Tax=Hermetia illucens TaxID=343691 RepID=UPI0018CC55B9|nr:uncharacterized protein LOC119660463 isoform X2 [Hermetia illucens]